MPRPLSPSGPRILVVAGHDPTGGAGVDADREAIAFLGARATCIVTARTDQDGRRVRSLGARAPDAWLAEALAELEPPPDALKLGLLPGAEHVRRARRLVDALPAGTPVVVDPVLAASGGETFLDDAGVLALLEELVPRGVALTPNLPEAARLTGLSAGELALDLDARIEAALSLLAAGAGLVVLKGGHGGEDPVRDLVLSPGRPPRWAEHARVPGRRLHGSGCRFASALAVGLAGGGDPLAAAERAGAWVARRIQDQGSPIGEGPESG